MHQTHQTPIHLYCGCLSNIRLARHSSLSRINLRVYRLIPRCYSTKTILAGNSITNQSHVKPDILIVGSGGAAMTAALRAKSLGLSPLIIEKTSYIGGSTAYSGGALWIPNSHLYPSVEDSIPEALEYMETLIGDVGSVSSRERKMAFLEEGPKMVKYLEAEGFKWRPTNGYPDYYPEFPGGKAEGRSIEGDIFDMKELGDWMGRVRMPDRFKNGFPMFGFEGATMFRAGCSIDGLSMALKVFLWRRARQKALGKFPVTMGLSLVSRLLQLTLQKEIPIWINTPMKALSLKDGTVIGAIVERDGKELTIDAPKGVLLAAGGFAHNSELRKKYHGAPITIEWTSTPPTDTGDAITAGMKIGAATALMDDAWWGPTLMDPRSNQAHWCQYERALPHSIIVDKAGNRFTNEAQSYTTFVHDQYERHRTVPAIPAFMILDSRHRKRYPLATFRPGKTPQESLDSGFIVKATTLDELAGKLDINIEGLNSTIKLFNEMVHKGVDKDYNRGANAYDAYFGDPKYKLNRSLGTIEKGPFYAVKIYPGDLGTKGGILTDQFARALRDDGSVIQNLYATGNSSASVMGREYAGAGSTLGPALTFAYIAVNHVASSS